MRFVDLFAGLGGFHVGLRRLGHKCVFACEIDPDLRRIYKRNFGIEPAGDVTKVKAERIPSHDILCAGFPCQPFSKAGDQQGLNCPKWGNLFEKHVLRIVRHHNPKYLFLENVPNLAHHNDGRTWKGFEAKLKRLGYEVDLKKISPHEFGIPQIRERVFIVGSRSNLHHFSWPQPNGRRKCSLTSVLDENPRAAKRITQQVIDCLDVWQDFVRRYPKDQQLPSFPIWSMEFGATYPYKDTTPRAMGTKALQKYRGSHGQKLAGLSRREVFPALPSYARTKQKKFPRWKVLFIEQNRDLYQRNKDWIDAWKPQVLRFPPSLQKFEWNIKGGERDVWKYVIQFRPSGVRIKRATTAPSLVAFTTTQIPIIGWESRYMTARECARVQSLRGLRHLPKTETGSSKALGNAVNADLVEMIAEKLLRRRNHKARRGMRAAK